MVDGLQSLGLDEQIVECLGRPTELGILKVFSYKGLHHSNGSDILLNGTVEVIIAKEHLSEEFHRTGDNHIECNAEDDQRDKENETHLEVDEHAHQHGENHVERCPDRYAHEHLEGVLENAGLVKKYSKKTVISATIMISMVLLSAFNILPLLSSCLLAAAAMIVFRCCTSTQAMNSINWEILMVFAGSICLGKALETTGVAQMIANNLLNLCGSNPYISLGVMCVVATFITEFISNTATAAMFCPIAISAATTLGVNPLTFCIALMISVSSSFATPIGSPTHMLVYGPGGYRFTDFVKIGVPMNFIILAANLFITPLIFPFK